jgi:hypothetical protein
MASQSLQTKIAQNSATGVGWLVRPHVPSFFNLELGAAWGGWFGPMSPPFFLFFTDGTGNETLSWGKGCGGCNEGGGGSGR